MPRASMDVLIKELRAICQASGTTQYTVNSVGYFTDDHLQTELDAVRVTHRDLPLDSQTEQVAGSTIWKDYRIPYFVDRWIERDTGIDSGWAVKDGRGNTISNSLYTALLENGLITFTTSTGGSALMLSCRSYNLNKAAARVWRMRAAFEALAVDWRSDNHDIKASQRRDYCNAMADLYEGKAGMMVGQMVNPDEL